MAKRGTFEHEKTMDLAEYLKIPTCYALGVLEALWHWVARCHKTGDLTGVRPNHVAQAIRFPGSPKILWDALVKARWIDVQGKKASIHDWSEHADDTTHKFLKRKGVNFCDGTPPYTRNRTRVTEEMSRHVATSSGQSPDMSRPPEPEPEPEPVARTNTEGLKRDRKITKNSSKQQQQQDFPYPEALRVAQEYFPTETDHQTILRIAAETAKTYPGVTDTELVAGFYATWSRDQKSPMRWGATVAKFLLNGNKKPPKKAEYKCNACQDTHQIHRPGLPDHGPKLMAALESGTATIPCPKCGEKHAKPAP